MNIIFGANSETPSDTRLTNGYTLFDWVMRKNCFPAFWGRTLLGKGKITAKELSFLRSKDCKIALIMRDLTEEKVSGGGGVRDAMRAIESAKAILVPQNEGIAVFAEFEPEWSVNHNWMISFARTLALYGYVPGFIGNTDSSKNFNFDRQCSHFVEGAGYAKCFGAVYCATEPKVSGMPEVWAPFSPSKLKPGDMHLWSCGKTAFAELEVENVYARDEKVLECMW